MSDVVPRGFEEMLRELYEELLRPGDNAVDVGAHVGDHTLPLARRVSPGGRVLAFEPLDVCRTALESRVRAEGLQSTVTVLPSTTDVSSTANSSNVQSERIASRASSQAPASRARQSRSVPAFSASPIQRASTRIDSAWRDWIRS